MQTSVIVLVTDSTVHDLAFGLWQLPERERVFLVSEGSVTLASTTTTNTLIKL
jgi:hypothetical protein